MKAFSLITFVYFLVLNTGLAVAQRDFAKVEIKATHVGGNIHMLEGVEDLSDEWQSWRSGSISTDRWIAIIYRSLTQ